MHLIDDNGEMNFGALTQRERRRGYFAIRAIVESKSVPSGARHQTCYLLLPGLRRVASCATPTGSAGHAGAAANV